MAKIVEIREVELANHRLRWERYSDGSRVISKDHHNGRMYASSTYTAVEMALIESWERQRFTGSEPRLVRRARASGILGPHNPGLAQGI